jgi:hypothetical protein
MFCVVIKVLEMLTNMRLKSLFFVDMNARPGRPLVEGLPCAFEDIEDARRKSVGRAIELTQNLYLARV